MADVAITATEADFWNQFRDRSNYVYINNNIGYFFQMIVGPSTHAANGVEYLKTVDGGLNWSGPTEVFKVSGSGVSDTDGFDIWYDRWTPGDPGTIINIFLFTGTGPTNTTTRVAKYFTLDTADDSLVEVASNFTNRTGLGSLGRSAAITKMEDGTLHTFISKNVSSTFAHELWRSTNAGVDWSLIASITGTEGLRFVMFPTASADDNDVLLLIWDVNGDDSVVAYAWDDSADDFVTAELGTTGDFVRISAALGNCWSSTLRQSDKTVLVPIHEDAVHGSHDLRFFTVHWDGADLTVTEKTAIFTGQTHGPAVAVTVDNTNNDDIYVAYSEGTLGSVVITMVKSTDGGATWATATQMSDDDTTYRSVWATPQIVNSGRIHPLFAKDATGPDTLQHHFVTNEFALGSNPSAGKSGGAGTLLQIGAI